MYLRSLLSHLLQHLIKHTRKGIETKFCVGAAGILSGRNVQIFYLSSATC